ncbi:hypothetical protein [Nocardioides humi]|uniref:Uncharacterized protein n=1 Tax=Nocardioides humi TaxID=449461 RepID=A0ABN1ZY08_9ACTN|nr:hypothetical protein [Nocardioides humi]
MWEQYEKPDDDQGRPAASSGVPDPGLSTGRSTRTGGDAGAGVALGIVGALAAVVIGIVVASSAGSTTNRESDDSDWYACIAEQKAQARGGLLSPADLCEIGHERPSGYVDDDEYDPLGRDGSRY